MVVIGHIRNWEPLVDQGDFGIEVSMEIIDEKEALEFFIKKVK